MTRASACGTLATVVVSLIVGQPLFVSSGALQMRDEQRLADDEFRRLESDAARLADEGKFRQGALRYHVNAAFRAIRASWCAAELVLSRTFLDVV